MARTPASTLTTDNLITTTMATANTSTPETSGTLYLMQAATSAFPTGAFSHSFGFETLISEGSVRDPATLEASARLWLRYGVARADAAVCGMAWLAAAGKKLDETVLALLDEELTALRITRETREASLSTGRAFMNAALDTFSGQRLARYRDLVTSSKCAGHYATAFGIAARDARIDQITTVNAFLHSSFSSLVSVAARIIPLGQVATQRMIADARDEINACAQIALATGVDDLGTATAWFDLASMAHERLYSRLCIS